MNKKNDNSMRVLVMCLADPSRDPRPKRAAELFASQGYDVSVMGRPLSQPFSAGAYFALPVLSPRIWHKILRRIWAIAVTFSPSEKTRVSCESKLFGLEEVKKLLKGETFDLLIVEDLKLLPLAFEIKRGAKILFDAREFYPREFEGNLWFDLFEKKRRISLCKQYLPLCDTIFTVSSGLQKEYAKEFGVETILYRSTPSYTEIPVSATNPERVRMVYHGAANRDRRLENLIEVLSMLDERFSLDLLLIGNPRYQQELRHKAASNERIAFPEPVSFEEIIPTIGRYDIGFFYCEPTTFNLRNCLPNKFFEYIQARLMIAIGPSPDMAELVREYGFGVVAEEFSVQSMAKALNALSTAEIDECKKQSDRAARELCFEKESEKMILLLDKLLARHTLKGEE